MKILAFFLLLPSLAAALPPAGPRAELRSELDLDGRFANRLLLRGPDGELMLLLERQSDGTASLWPGLALPTLVAGPLRAAGLLREMLNPLGYRAGSAVFRERTRFSLDRSLGGGPRGGLAVSLLPDGLDLFLCGSPPAADADPQWDGGPNGSSGLLQEAGLQAGAVLRARLGEARLEALLAACHPRPSPPRETWYPSEPSFPGGRLAHAGLRVGGEAAGARLLVSGGLSAGELVEPGLFLHLDLGLRAAGRSPAGMDLDLFGGLCTAEYVTPTGEGVEEELAAGLRLSGRPSAPGWWRLEAWRSIDRVPPAGAVGAARNFREGQAGLAAQARWSPPRRGRFRPALETQAELVAHYPREGGRELSGAFELRFGQGMAPAVRRTAGLQATLGWDEGWRAGLEGALRRDAVRLRLGYELRRDLPGPPEHRWKAALEREVAGGRLYLSAGPERAVLGWQTGAPAGSQAGLEREISPRRRR